MLLVIIIIRVTMVLKLGIRMKSLIRVTMLLKLGICMKYMKSLSIVGAVFRFL